MANMNVRTRIENISNDLDKVLEHIAQYSGIDPKDARIIDNMATAIAEAASRIAALARLEAGDRSANKLSKNVRKALGFTRP